MRINKASSWLSFSAMIFFMNCALNATSRFYDFPVDLNFSNQPQFGATVFSPYTASSVQNASYAPNLAFDGSSATRWSSLFSDPQWITVNYGSVKTISQVVIQWEAAYAKTYKIQVSANGTNWTDVYSTINGAGGRETVTFAPVNAQYLRLYGTQRATPYGYSIYEMTVNSSEPKITALASSQQSASYSPLNAIDNSLTTRWSSQFSDPQWLRLDLINSKTVNAVTLNWEAAYAKTYKIQISNDNTLWTDVFSTTSGKGGQEVIRFNAVAARYVRMYGTQRATPYGYSLFDIRVATAAANPPPPSTDTSPPTIAIVSPANGTTASATVSITGTAQDNAGVAKVEVRVDNGSFAQASGLSNWSYGLNTLTLSNGAHTITVRAVDTSSNTATFSISLNVQNQQTVLGPSFTMVPGREFAADSFVHKPLADDAALDANSAVYVANLVRQIGQYYGVAAVNINQYTPAIFVVPANQPTVRVKAWDRSNANWSFQPLQDKWAAVPLPDGFVPASGTDQEAVIYQPSTGKMWEFWLMQKTGAKVVNSAGQSVDEWGARWGGRMDSISTNPGYFLTEGGDWNTLTGMKFGTTATSLAFLGGILTIQEQQNGVIDHVVGVALPEVLAYPRWSYPANRSDGQISASNAIPEGTIFRFPANLNLDQIAMDPYARMIAKAVQKHGMVVWDRAGTVSFRAENPANQYPEGNPYTKSGGILACPGGISQQSCWADSNGRLKGFPWDKLQAVKTIMNQ